MNIFVTGGTGVRGKQGVRRRVEDGHKVYALRSSEENTAAVRQLGAEPITANLFDLESLIKALETTRAEAIVHLATKIPPTSRMGKLSSWQENDRIRRDGTRTLVDAALAVGVQSLIYPSFYYVYPDSGDRWIDALSTPVQSHVIPQSTIDAEAEVARFTKEQRRGIVLRMGSLYGPEVPSALEQFHLAQKGFAALPGSGDAYLSYIWAEDAARAIVVALDEAPAGIYDIVDDEPLTRDAFATALAHSVGRRRLFRIPNSVMKLLAGAAAQTGRLRPHGLKPPLRELTSPEPTLTHQTNGWSLSS